MISVNQAYQQILDRVPDPAVERVSADRASGRILHESVLAERDAPPFDRVMMDGYAIHYHQPISKAFRNTGIALAGYAPPALSHDSDCIEVTTGCPLPPGCDTVIPVENCIQEGSLIRLRETESIERGQYIHREGSDGLAGRVVLRARTRLGPPELAILATEGIDSLAAGKTPSIHLLTTGDEIAFQGHKPEPAQIRGSHFEALRGLFSALPGLELSRTHARDDPQDLSDKLNEALEKSDILLITGGVSRGRKDLVPELLKKSGVEEILHRVAQRPGKPLWFGAKGNKLVLGLPGNPISTLICARRYAVPVIQKWMGGDPQPLPRITLGSEVEPMDEFTRFVPVKLGRDEALAEPFSTSGSLHDLVGTDGFVEVPPKGITDQQFKYFSWRF